MRPHEFISKQEFIRNAYNHKYCIYIGNETLVKAALDNATVFITDCKNNTIISYKSNANIGIDDSNIGNKFNINFILKNGNLREEFKYDRGIEPIEELVNILLGIYHECKCPITHNPIEHGFVISNNGDGFRVEMVKIENYYN